MRSLKWSHPNSEAAGQCGLLGLPADPTFVFSAQAFRCHFPESCAQRKQYSDATSNLYHRRRRKMQHSLSKLNGPDCRNTVAGANPSHTSASPFVLNSDQNSFPLFLCTDDILSHRLYCAVELIASAACCAAHSTSTAYIVGVTSAYANSEHPCELSGNPTRSRSCRPGTYLCNTS